MTPRRQPEYRLLVSRITISAFIGWLGLAAPSLACLNMYGTSLEGRPEVSNRFPDTVYGLRHVEIDRDHWTAVEAELAPGFESGDYKHRTDYAVALIYLGRYDEAIAILEEVEERQPGEDLVATNLGTAYELSGDLDRALVWIQEGFERNPESHGGSEWLHVRILEARRHLEEDPDWLKTHSVLGLDFGRQPAPSRPSRAIVDSIGRSHPLEMVAGEIEYQLHERLQFVPPQDPIVGDLLFDLGNIMALIDVVEWAVPAYEFAQEYGVQNLPLLESRINHLRNLSAGNPLSGYRQNTLMMAGLLVLLLAVLALFAWFMYKRRVRQPAI